MTMRLRFEKPRKGHNVILPVVASAAMAATGLLPLVSALPSVAQTATTENIVAKDTVRSPIPALNTILRIQATKPTVAKVGDVIVQIEVEYFSKTADYFTLGWKVTKIDAICIEISPILKSETFMSEQTIADFSKAGERVNYGNERTVSFPCLISAHPGLPVTIKAEKGRAPGTATVTTVFSKAGMDTAQLALLRNIDTTRAALLRKLDTLSDEGFFSETNNGNTTETKTVEAGSHIAVLGTVTRIDDKGVEFVWADSVDGWVRRTMCCSVRFSREDRRVDRMDYGKAHSIGEENFHSSVIVEKGPRPGTAKIILVNVPDELVQ
jgi:hypothetical protein